MLIAAHIAAVNRPRSIEIESNTYIPRINTPPGSNSVETGHVLYIEIEEKTTAASQLLADHIKELNRLVTTSPAFREADRTEKIVKLPNGTGLTLVFLNGVDSALACAVQITKAVNNQTTLRLRMGIHTGDVVFIKDLNDNWNVVGEGINTAKRVMEAGDSGHILVSREVGEELEHPHSGIPLPHDLGTVSISHVGIQHIYNLYGRGIGNPQHPSSLIQKQNNSQVMVLKLANRFKPFVIAINRTWLYIALLVAICAGVLSTPVVHEVTQQTLHQYMEHAAKPPSTR